LGAVWDIQQAIKAYDKGDDLGAISSGSSAAAGILILSGAAAAALGFEGGVVAILTGPAGVIVVPLAAITATGINVYWDAQLENEKDSHKNGECQFLLDGANAVMSEMQTSGCCKDCKK
jgi:hypothetical protein